MDEWYPELQIAPRADPYLAVAVAEAKVLRDTRSVEDGGAIRSDILDGQPTDYQDENGSMQQATIDGIIEVDGSDYALLRTRRRTGGKRFQLYRLQRRGDRSVLKSVEGEEFEFLLRRLEERGAGHASWPRWQS